jgi:copper oxidase (laccase) domain-containing protein
LLALLSEKSGVPVSRIQALFGPCIRRKNYEVGPEFLKIFPRTTTREKDGLRFDLAAENRRQIETLGADPERLSDVHLDTFAEAGELYSFRREKERAGRLVSFMVKSDFS